ncbi:AraC family transcriptional regulator [Sinimarinibacterium sp. HSW-8]|uniref:AraC family transcriptional regulator n=2 Tax=Sinimarinibacterium thermocellulolyticum TaxID=3170016 RepID=A0ABV2A7G8_9GAMM
MEKDSVSISFVVEALRPVRRRGHDVAALLQAAGIPEGLLGSPQSRVPAQCFSALWLAVAALLDDELFGLDSRRMKVGSFAAITYGCVGARTLAEAVRRMVRLFGIILDDTALELELGQDGTQAELRLRPTPRAAGKPIVPFAHETLLVMAHGLMCWLAGRRIPIQRAEFAYPAPPHWAEYRVMYSPQLAFEQPCTRIVFDAALLAVPVRQTQRSATAFLRAAPYTIVLKYKSAESWTARVRRALRDTAPDRWPGFDALARRLDSTPSALRRALEREGSSFRAIKDALRRDLAIALLSEGTRPIPEIARAVGFAEASAFHRAFKLWTGVQPGAYRRRRAGAQAR